jgi:murein DD-endopeptidase MepM/ murein hydrolase activator NlpD
MQNFNQTIAELGNEPPLIADGRSGPPDRREVSARWLSGTFLTGLTSSVLMGVALFAALDGREQLATPPEIANLVEMRADGDTGQDAKEARVLQPRQVVRAKDRRRLEVSTVSRVGDTDVVTAMPVMQVRMTLAAGYKTNRSYPPYDPADMALDDEVAKPKATTQAAQPQIYAAKAESDMVLNTVDFPLDAAVFDEKSDLSADEVERVVRKTADELTDGDVQVAALHYVDPQRFGESVAESLAAAGYGIKITQENVSVAPRSTPDGEETVFAEDMIPFMTERRMDVALENAGYDRDESARFAERLAGLLNGSELRAGSLLRVGLQVKGDAPKIVRVSVYDGDNHIVSVALNDGGQIALADPPERNPDILAAFDDSPPIPSRGSLPTIYDSVYRAAFANGMSRDSAKRLVRLLSSEIELKSRVGKSDKLEVLFSQPDENNAMSDESQLLYVAATFGGATRRYYRFQFPDGTVDYFNEKGRNARQSMLRNPVPAGKFRSGFGSRVHPILRYRKMHTGVDWSAPTGTPIISVGDGVVEKAGWAGGYGKQTIIRHGNGYETSYNHQSRFAPGIKPGAKVRQGQLIGYVGTTGLSTGAHLHFEVIVNDTKVDPMRIRLPGGKALTGEQLAAFNKERERIDDLLKEDAAGSLRMASKN